MHTVELLEQTIGAAEKLGYGVRHEWLGGTGGGACEFAGRKWIFVDLSLSVIEQLDQVTEALRSDPAAALIPLPPAVHATLGLKRVA
jgi:hypothetical protein